MICSQCGSPIPEGMLFCTECGARQTPAADFPPVPPVAPAYPAPGYAPNTPAAPAAPVDKWRRHFLKSWRRFASSTPALALLICATLVQILGLFGVADSGLMGAALGSIAGEDAAKTLGDTFAFTSFLGMIPGILTLVAMWLLYLDARKPGPRLNTTGMMILKIMQIVTLVGICIVCGIGLLLMLGLTGSASKADLGGLSDLLGMGAWLVAIVGALAIGYQVLVLKTISAIKTTMETAAPNPGFAMVLGILQIVSGAFSLISSFIGDFSFGTLLSVACSVLYGVLLIQYKQLMDKLNRQYRRAHPAARPY